LLLDKMDSVPDTTLDSVLILFTTDAIHKAVNVTKYNELRVCTHAVREVAGEHPQGPQHSTASHWTHTDE